MSASLGEDTAGGAHAPPPLGSSLEDLAGLISEQLDSWVVLPAQLSAWWVGEEQMLPEGWEARTTQAGDVYYIDHFGKRTTWAHPSVVSSPRLALNKNLLHVLVYAAKGVGGEGRARGGFFSTPKLDPYVKVTVTSVNGAQTQRTLTVVANQEQGAEW
jgi:hypothetical protein